MQEKRKQSFQSRVEEWTTLAAAAEVHEAALPALCQFGAALTDALENLIALKARLHDLEAERQETRQRFDKQLASCREVAARVKSYAKAWFSRYDERLADFGITLRSTAARGRRRRLKLEKGGNGSPGYH